MMTSYACPVCGQQVHADLQELDYPRYGLHHTQRTELALRTGHNVVARTITTPCPMSGETIREDT